MMTALIPGIQQMNIFICSLFLRLTTTGPICSVLLQFEPKKGNPVDGKRAWLALKNIYQNTSCQRRRTFLRPLDTSVMKADTNADVFLSDYINYTTNSVICTKYFPFIA